MLLLYCTAPDEASAQDLAAKVLAEKLAACVTLLPGHLPVTTGRSKVAEVRSPDAA
jgi:uncharacterized protein involved in tolerance to divalent cations